MTDATITDGNTSVYNTIVAGDGNAYTAYSHGDLNLPITYHLMPMQVDSSGNANKIDIQDYTPPDGESAIFTVGMITNADTGVLLSWEMNPAPIRRPS